MRVSFQEVAIYGQKSVKCAGGCKRTLKRSKKFFQTLSPFNKNKSGQLKTSAEISAELTVEVNDWKAEPETCSHCAELRVAV